MTELNPASSFEHAAKPDDHLEIDQAILAWFKARGRGWQEELTGILEFYIHTAEHPASDPDYEPPGIKPGPP